jgi:hypothetical protein
MSVASSNARRERRVVIGAALGWVALTVAIFPLSHGLFPFHIVRMERAKTINC